MNNVTSLDRHRKFTWLVFSDQVFCSSVQAANPWEAMRIVAESNQGPLTFTGSYPEDDGVEWRPEWDTPPQGWVRG